MIEIFTDGSFKKDHCGIGIYFPKKEFPNVSLKFTIEPLTNQRAELYAILVALKLVESDVNLKKQDVVIYSDSEYSIKSLTIWIKKWKLNNWNKNTVKNQDLIKPIDQLLSKLNVTFKHVRSHTGKTDRLSIGNDYADKLAK